MAIPLLKSSSLLPLVEAVETAAAVATANAAAADADRIAAEAAQAAASTSATAAATSATSAGTSATNAGTQATNAAGSATTASTGAATATGAAALAVAARDLAVPGASAATAAASVAVNASSQASIHARTAGAGTGAPGDSRVRFGSAAAEGSVEDQAWDTTDWTSTESGGVSIGDFGPAGPFLTATNDAGTGQIVIDTTTGPLASVDRFALLLTSTGVRNQYGTAGRLSATVELRTTIDSLAPDGAVAASGLTGVRVPGLIAWEDMPLVVSTTAGAVRVTRIVINITLAAGTDFADAGFELVAAPYRRVIPPETAALELGAETRRRRVIVVTATGTIPGGSADDSGRIVRATTGGSTQTLPPLTGITPAANRDGYIITVVNDSAGTVTVAAAITIHGDVSLGTRGESHDYLYVHNGGSPYWLSLNT